ncbi:MAG: hypothetical protein LH660_06345 [Phormidesmis sp. CAN_BIN36]|nr:hypothetical protein [Phormidesmis sp. CAN_BIN36]
MSSFKSKKRSSLMFWSAVLGMAYFNAFSSLDINSGLRNGLAIAPILLGLGLVRHFQKKPSQAPR